MNNEYEILSHLEKNKDMSQRQIASRTLRYILTPGGMTEKTRLAYQYLKASYGQIIKISRAVDEVVAAHQAARAEQFNSKYNVVNILEIL
ncbi:hypothetical protein SPSYN_00105 [Sporotomaculum syntrophicum]|uniref:Uncharacterized protein n=1 Tax=Sporotomaculum syntrophicum TaxID=182264 RepID=A0A9D2WRN4_9FIRM|nr:hypothetical protein [Sporotomaculum syntrophicum]KAF1086387.1 hypothetical protein SPSYN_00105 [Sporotomaculum syntrophicum]